MGNSSPRTSHILIVDDDQGTCNFLVTLLSQSYQVHIANTAADARRILEEVSIDLMIEDISLPDGNGIDLLCELKSRYSSHAQTIIMSGAGTIQSAQFAMDLGAIAYLLKPLNITELLTLVYTALDPLGVQTHASASAPPVQRCNGNCARCPSSQAHAFTSAPSTLATVTASPYNPGGTMRQTATGPHRSSN